MKQYYGSGSCVYCGHDCGRFAINNPRDIGDGVQLWDVVNPFNCPGCGNLRTEFQTYFIELPPMTPQIMDDMPVFYPRKDA